MASFSFMSICFLFIRKGPQTLPTRESHFSPISYIPTILYLHFVDLKPDFPVYSIAKSLYPILEFHKLEITFRLLTVVMYVIVKVSIRESN